MRVFLLSPASSSGRRARMLLSPSAAFSLAAALHSEEGAPLGDVFAFLSGLYFRGKLAYARAFAHPAAGDSAVLVITPNRGLLPPDARVTPAALRSFARVDIHADEPRYRRPFVRDARLLDAAVGSGAEVVLLGSVATGKYVDVLLETFGRRLVFPTAFVGRGDMSRGGLMLRAARDGRELDYAPVDGAVRHGPRPPRLPPLARAGAPEEA